MSDQVVHSYLDQLRIAADSLPPRRREELLAEIREHLEEARRSPDGDTESAVRTAMDRLGTPEEIAAAALAEEGTGGVAADPSRPTGRRQLPGRDLAAVILLPFGAFIFVVGWFVGVVLLWSSEHWTTRHKLTGTLVLPFGVALTLFLGPLVTLIPVRTTACASGVVNAETGEPVGPGGTCESTGAMPAWLGIGIFVVLLLAPIVTAIWLATRAHAFRRARS